MKQPEETLSEGAKGSDPESDREDLFEQYKLFVRSTDEVDARCATANHDFLGVKSLFVAVQALGKAIQPESRWEHALPLAGLIISFSWCRWIRSCPNVNCANFKVIHELKSRLLSPLNNDEWESMSKGHSYSDKSH